MEIKELHGGKNMNIHRTDSILPPGLDRPRGRLSAPGNLDGNVALGMILDEAARRALGQPRVARVRVIFKEYPGVIYLLIVPLMGSAEVPEEELQRSPNIYEWKLHKKSPRVTGLQWLFEATGIPLREDQWHWCDAELVEDREEGYAVALNWTQAEMEPRDIVAERQYRAEAERRRRAERRLQTEGGGK